ncbi:CRISPR-associated endonuclease Cas2 [Syntrophomonas palmitatica]|uniref:CRISPR-associated endonuclease Cas2 n=1 Tax=Syntrophomonas palmitatica TaxID=402877 RepID=UPI0006CFE10A|nr:CRISPR-associated endonuclease Cas2 [Syntrophomonas palmitatica]
MQSHNRIFIFDEFIAEERRKYLVVIIYDIVDNRRRAAFAKYLQGFGIRVQKSAFECILPQSKYDKLVKGIPGLIAPEDQVRVYKLTSNADIKYWGSVELLEEEEVVII